MPILWHSAFLQKSLFWEKFFVSENIFIFAKNPIRSNYNGNNKSQCSLNYYRNWNRFDLPETTAKIDIISLSLHPVKKWN